MNLINVQTITTSFSWSLALLHHLLYVVLLEPSVVRNVPNQDTGLGNIGRLKILNGIKLILNACSFRINLVSFRTFRQPLFSKPISWLGLFLPFLTVRWLYYRNQSLRFLTFGFFLIVLDRKCKKMLLFYSK